MFEDSLGGIQFGPHGNLYVASFTNTNVPLQEGALIGYDKSTGALLNIYGINGNPTGILFHDFPAAVPEPGSLAMAALDLLGLYAAHSLPFRRWQDRRELR